MQIQGPGNAMTGRALLLHDQGSQALGSTVFFADLRDRGSQALGSTVFFADFMIRGARISHFRREFPGKKFTSAYCPCQLQYHNGLLELK